MLLNILQYWNFPKGGARFDVVDEYVTSVLTTPASSVNEVPSPSVHVSPDEGAMFDRAPSVTFVDGDESGKQAGVMHVGDVLLLSHTEYI